MKDITNSKCLYKWNLNFSVFQFLVNELWLNIDKMPSESKSESMSKY